jgi:hypothetical protein
LDETHIDGEDWVLYSMNYRIFLLTVKAFQNLYVLLMQKFQKLLLFNQLKL